MLIESGVSLFSLILHVFSFIAFVSANPNLGGASGDENQRIVVGVEATEGEFPFQVSVQHSGTHVCGGSIVKDDWILTAAHCVSSHIGGPSSYSIVAGSLSAIRPDLVAQFRNISLIKLHQDFDESTLVNDIALIQVEQSLILDLETLHTSTIELPPTGFSPPAGTNGTVSGWGRTSSQGYPPVEDPLRKIQVPIISDDICDENYKSWGGINGDMMMCAGTGEGDACQGDGGGGLTTEFAGIQFLTGIVSWGIGCSNTVRPGVYTEVQYYRHWIDEVLTAG